VRVNTGVVEIHRNGKGIESGVVGFNGHKETIRGSDFISTMPVTEFIKRLIRPHPRLVFNAAEKLSYRDFLTVCLIVNKHDLNLQGYAMGKQRNTSAAISNEHYRSNQTSGAFKS
jgi:protoporphyrinogen oxidase